MVRVTSSAAAFDVLILIEKTTLAALAMEMDKTDGEKRQKM